MRRRDVLSLAAGAAVTPLLGARPARAAPMDAPFAPLDVSPDRAIRTVAGLRPYRPSGFVVRAERLTWRKTLIHNYGHGGCGITLSWGAAQLAAEEALGASDAKSYAVIGCGVSGLTTALALLRAGREVTIYAEATPPYVTSNIASAVWGPFTIYDREVATDAFLGQFDRAVRIAHRTFQHYVNDPGYGVRWIRDVALLNAAPAGAAAEISPDPHRPGLGLDPHAAERFGAPAAISYYTMMIDPDIFLRALMRDVENAGGRIVRMRFERVDEVARLHADAIVNCTGLGAGALFGDAELTPVRGQLTVLLPQAEIDYGYSHQARDGSLLYMYPRQSAIILGGTVQPGESEVVIDETERARMLAGHAAIAGRLSASAGE